MWCRPHRCIVGGMRKLAGMIQPRDTKTRLAATLEWQMNRLIDCFLRGSSVSCFRNKYLLPCSNGIQWWVCDWLHLWILNNVANRDPENDSHAVCQGLVYIPQKGLWGRFEVPSWFSHCLDDQFRSLCFDFQWWEWWILFTRYTSMAYDKWDWQIDHWLI